MGRFHRWFTSVSLFFVSLPILAGRGDRLLPQVQFDQIRTLIIDLQENVDLKTGVPYYTRNSYHRPAADNAARIIANTFRQSPRLHVREENFSGLKNIVADLPARSDSNSSGDRIFIISAHYDSKANLSANWHPLLSKAPGANDNASGISSMLEIARILSAYEYDHHLRFVAFDGEEIGLIGSRYHARQAVQRGESIAAVINLDMIGYNWKTNLLQIAVDQSSHWLSKAFQISNQWYDLGFLLDIVVDPMFVDSDHQPFWAAGYSAVTLIESTTPWRDGKGYDANPFFHTQQDTVDKLNIRLIEKVTKLTLVTMDSLLSHSFVDKNPQSGEFPRPIEEFHITFNPIVQAQINPVKISGQVMTPFPVQIIISPGNVVANLNRIETPDHWLTPDLLQASFSAQVHLSPGPNHLQVAIANQFGVMAVEKMVDFGPAFQLEEIKIYPNPVLAGHNQITFQTIANQPIDSIRYTVLASNGQIIRLLEGVVDNTYPQVGFGWWNGRVAYGNKVATGVYICRADVQFQGQTYSISETLAMAK